MDQSHLPRLTYKVHLSGGQNRLREAALYVMQKCADAESFGLTKLNKILWRADFSAFAERGVPVTGRQYQKLKHGPAPVEMLPILNELQATGLAVIGKGGDEPFAEQRPSALADASLRYFSEDDLSYLDEAVRFYWDYTNTGVSNHSHGVAWRTRKIGDPMPYQAAYLSDDKISGSLRERLLSIGESRHWKTL